MRVLVVGAAGNLGSTFSQALLDSGYLVRMTVHRTPLRAELAAHANAEVCALDLDRPGEAAAAVEGVDAVVHCAGLLFAPDPERFLERTNVAWARAMIDAAASASVRAFVLLSFPHVEEDKTPERPGTGSQDGRPRAIHARTRLEAERYLMNACGAMRPVVLRLGMVYGPGVKMFEAARKLLRWRLLPVWQSPTWVHLIFLEDAARAVVAAVANTGCSGVYNVCDEAPLTLQSFLDKVADNGSYGRPIRAPQWTFRLAARLCESGARLLRTPAPLNRDILQMGMTSAVADTARFRRELLRDLVCPTVDDGLRRLRPRTAR